MSYMPNQRGQNKTPRMNSHAQSGITAQNPMPAQQSMSAMMPPQFRGAGAVQPMPTPMMQHMPAPIAQPMPAPAAQPMPAPAAQPVRQSKRSPAANNAQFGGVSPWQTQPMSYVGMPGATSHNPTARPSMRGTGRFNQMAHDNAFGNNHYGGFFNRSAPQPVKNVEPTAQPDHIGAAEQPDSPWGSQPNSPWAPQQRTALNDVWYGSTTARAYGLPKTAPIVQAKRPY